MRRCALALAALQATHACPFAEDTSGSLPPNHPEIGTRRQLQGYGGSTAPDATGSVYVANQGIFSDNSGSVSRYDPETGTATADLVPGLGGLTRPQLTTAFGKQLTELSSKFIESPPMQLQAIGAMRRRTNKGMKGPRGVRAGLGLVGAVRSQAGGGQGNLATFAGYQAGLNSAHLMFANDGLIPDSSGNEPPFFRWQPKMNFDISI